MSSIKKDLLLRRVCSRIVDKFMNLIVPRCGLKICQESGHGCRIAVVELGNVYVEANKANQAIGVIKKRNRGGFNAPTIMQL